MKHRRGWHPSWGLARLVLVTLGVLALVTAGAFTAANTVPETNVDDQTLPVLPESGTPPDECQGIEFDVTGYGSGVIAGSIDNDWIIGSDQADTISGLAGADCIEGKGANDVIDGGLGNDVCLGGPGVDVFIGCETQVQ